MTPRLWCPVGEGHGEGVFDQLGAHVIGQGPAHHPPAGQVDDGGQIGPALPGRDVGDVADIAAVDLLARARSGAGSGHVAASASGSATVVLRQRFLQRPSRPARRMSLVTRRRPQATPRSSSSRWTRGEP